MRKFLARSFWFILPMLAMIIALEVGLRDIPNDYSYKHDRLRKDGATFDFLVLGNSHAYRGVDPQQMRSTGFNASNISQDHKLDRVLLESYLADLPNLKVILLPVSYASIGSRLANGSEAWRTKNYVLYMGLPVKSEGLEQRLELLNRPMREQVRMLRDYWLTGEDNVQCDRSGAGLKAMPDTLDIRAYAVKAAARHRANSSSVVAENRKELERISDLAMERGIRVILFMPPALAPYRERLDTLQLATVLAIAGELDSKKPNVEFHDLLADPRFEISDFSDADHLGPAGASKLSSILEGYMTYPNGR